MNPNTERILEKIKAELLRYEEPQRIEHTLGVLGECRFFADFFRLDEEEERALLTAALLHDLAKSVPEDEEPALFARYGIAGADATPPVRHQFLGAPMAKEAFGEEIVSDAVVSAIGCHTTGKPGMSRLDKMLFVADFTEAGRKYRSCTEMREYLHSKCAKLNANDASAKERLLNDVVKRILGYTITYLVEKGKDVDIETVLTWNDLIRQEKGDS